MSSESETVTRDESISRGKFAERLIQEMAEVPNNTVM